IIDECRAYTGYYAAGKRGYEGPMLRFDSSDEAGLFYPMNQYFEKLWDSSKGPLREDDPLFELREFTYEDKA
ncbi:MAG TPA: hypothetical protein VGM23_06255, partial [Armatimonadota bacterium]